MCNKRITWLFTKSEQVLGPTPSKHKKNSWNNQRHRFQASQNLPHRENDSRIFNNNTLGSHKKN
jgi:hypothetical protein